MMGVLNIWTALFLLAGFVLIFGLFWAWCKYRQGRRKAAKSSANKDLESCTAEISCFEDNVTQTPGQSPGRFGEIPRTSGKRNLLPGIYTPMKEVMALNRTNSAAQNNNSGPSSANSDEYTKKRMRECRILLALGRQHPNITPPPFPEPNTSNPSSSDENETPTLKKYLEAQRQLMLCPTSSSAAETWSQISQLVPWWAYQISDAMDFAHSKNVIHCEISAENIRVYGNWHLKLTNFGSAFELGDTRVETSAFDFKDSMQWKWWPIELLQLVKSQREVKFSKCSDVWAFGLTLYEIYTLGREPHVNKSMGDVLRGLESTPVFCRQDFEFGVPEQMYYLMRKCCAPDLRLRIKFSDLKLTLKQILSPEMHRKVFPTSNGMEENCVRVDVHPTPPLVSNFDHESTPGIYDLKKRRFQKGQLLGKGCFGEVFAATFLDEDTVPVAVKYLNCKKVSKNIFMSELDSMVRLSIHEGGHQNVVRLLGACTEIVEGFYSLALELCDLTSIDQFLITNQDLTPIGSSFDEMILLQWAREIAAGMEFLHHRCKISHGDLATRNILLKNMIAKISDFGFSRNFLHYNSVSANTMRDLNLLPWQIMAPEAIIDKKSRMPADVWSFGVLLWQLFTLGEEPYSKTEPVWDALTQEFLDWIAVNNRHRLARPPHVADEIFGVIEQCWEYDPLNRPTFPVLTAQIININFENLETQDGLNVGLEQFLLNC